MKHVDDENGDPDSEYDHVLKVIGRWQTEESVCAYLAGALTHLVAHRGNSEYREYKSALQHR